MITIILTCTVYVNYKKWCLYQTDASERVQIYLKSIQQWLKTNFHIVVVENSGYTFPELDEEKEIYKDRFEIITLDETIEPAHLRNHSCKGASEMFSIYYAFKTSKIISSFVIKVTGRFFIPELEEYLQELTNYDCLTQQDRDRCEMVGCQSTHFSHIFNIELDKNYKGHIEDIWKLRTSNYKNFACKVFDIEPTIRGGVNEVYTTI